MHSAGASETTSGPDSVEIVLNLFVWLFAVCLYKWTPVDEEPCCDVVPISSAACSFRPLCLRQHSSNCRLSFHTAQSGRNLNLMHIKTNATCKARASDNHKWLNDSQWSLWERDIWWGYLKATCKDYPSRCELISALKIFWNYSIFFYKQLA